MEISAGLEAPTDALIDDHRPGLYDQVPEDFKTCFLDHCKQTNRPESFPGLFYGRIDKDEPFTKISNVPEIGKLRLADDRIPCPICFHRSKYASDGHLVYFHRIKRIAAIGPECANTLNLLRADKDYRATEELQRNEAYLRQMLPLTMEWIPQLNAAKAAMEFARTLSSEFNKQAKNTRNRLKRGSAGDGWLGADMDGQHVTIGRLTGLGALSGQFTARSPLLEAEKLIIKHKCGKQNEAVEARILELAQANGVNQAAKDIRNGINKYNAFVKNMTEFCSFFTTQNLAIASQWSQSLSESDRFTFRMTENGTGRTIAVLSIGERARLTTDDAMWKYSDSLTGTGE